MVENHRTTLFANKVERSKGIKVFTRKWVAGVSTFGEAISVLIYHQIL